MSVIAIVNKIGVRSQIWLFCKGAPEKVLELCKPETIPHKLLSLLSWCTSNGFRVLAAANKPIENIEPKAGDLNKIYKLQRNSIEKNLHFGGLILLKNELKPETKATLKSLQDANFRTIMITGDSLLTGINVAYESGMIPPDGKLIVVEGQITGQNSQRKAFLKFDLYRKPNLSEEILGDLSETVESQGVNNSSIPVTFKSEPEQQISLGKTSESQQIEQESIPLSEPKYFFAVAGPTYGIIKKYFPEVYQTVRN